MCTRQWQLPIRPIEVFNVLWRCWAAPPQPQTQAGLKMQTIMGWTMPVGDSSRMPAKLFLEEAPYSFSLTWDPMGAKISKRYSSYKSQPNVFKLVLLFPPMVLTKLRWGFWNFEVSFFNDFFIFFIFTTVAYGKWKTSIIWKTNHNRAKRSEIWDSLVVVHHHIWGTFGLVAFKVILMSFGALSIFRNLGLRIRDGREHLSGYNS